MAGRRRQLEQDRDSPPMSATIEEGGGLLIASVTLKRGEQRRGLGGPPQTGSVGSTASGLRRCRGRVLVGGLPG